MDIGELGISELDIGDVGYLDGRDPDAQPPLTVGRINLWDSSDRKRVVGKLRHGSKVRILEKEWKEEEGRWYYFVRHFPLKRGWIPESFLSSKYQEPIGDLV